MTGAATYDVYLSRCNFKGKVYKPVKIATVTGTSYRVGGLKKHTCHKFYIVAKDATGRAFAKSNTRHAATGNYSGKYTNAKSLNVDRTTVWLSKGSSTVVKGTLTKVKKKKELLDRGHGAKLRYFSNNPAVATVNSTGQITGISEGWCKIYVQSLNGIWREVEVYVK